MSEQERAAGREAAARRDWGSAFVALAAADRESPLAAEDLEVLGEAAFWTGHHDLSIATRQRAFTDHEGRGESRRAGFVALLLTYDHLTRQAFVVADGWYQTATRLLADAPECAERGWLNWMQVLFAAFVERDSPRAVSLARELCELGRRLDEADLLGLGLGSEAAILVHDGEVNEGLASLDESMTLAITGKLGAFVTGLAYCSTLSTCSALGDYPRATEWSTEIERVSGGELRDLPGDWRLHRAELLRLHGDWAEAETEVTRACAELENYDRAHLALGLYELGEISRHRGDTDGAAEAYARAADLGRDPNPGRAQLWLDQGDNVRAAAEIDAALALAGSDRLLQGQLLPAAVQIALRTGDRGLAARRSEQLTRLADDYGSVALRARAEAARGVVALAQGNAKSAVGSLRDAVKHWRHAGDPHQVAMTRVALAGALDASGDDAAARDELEQALLVFERLGAVGDRERTAGLLGRPTARRRVVRTFMFTDIEDSTSLLAAMGDDAWSDVLEAHDRLLRDCFVDNGGQEIKQRGGGDGFFVVFETPSSAARCAVEMQQRLDTQRRERGFAPHVRVGFHEAEALMAASDYSGRGVHETARIAALAGGDEIIASATAAEAAGAIRYDKQRQVNLRGLPGEIGVVTVLWR